MVLHNIGRVLPSQVWLDQMLPPRCPACGEAAVASAGLCAACWRQLRPLGSGGCARCGVAMSREAEPGRPRVCENCMAQAPPYELARAAFAYEGPVRRLLLRFKHGDRVEMAPLLVRWLEAACTPQMRACDLVVPIPIHRWRLWHRRYNQAAELARGLARRWDGARYAPAVLVRQRATPSQGHLSRVERVRNVAGAFAVPDPTRVAGQRVLLVDDVMTSGATVAEAARVLHAAGATAVSVVAVARALPRWVA